MELVLVRPGSFVMGDERGGSGERPAHKVTVTKPFFIGKYLVTQRQWEAVMGNNPSWFQGAAKPVENITWDDCQVFLAKLGEKCGGGTEAFSLPTEAQWEYACRAGSTTKYSFGDDGSGLGEYAWFSGNSRNETHPVGEKKPNAWGLYDMHGNVWQWCADGYDAEYYKASPASNPAGPAGKDYAVIRGGGWESDAPYCRSAYRCGHAVGSDHANFIGFRVICRGKEPAKPAYEVRSPGIAVELLANGAIAGVVLGDGKLHRRVTGGTQLAGCTVQGAVRRAATGRRRHGVQPHSGLTEPFAAVRASGPVPADQGQRPLGGRGPQWSGRPMDDGDHNAPGLPRRHIADVLDRLVRSRAPGRPVARSVRSSAPSPRLPGPTRTPSRCPSGATTLHCRWRPWPSRPRTPR